MERILLWFVLVIVLAEVGSPMFHILLNIYDVRVYLLLVLIAWMEQNSSSSESIDNTAVGTEYWCNRGKLDAIRLSLQYISSSEIGSNSDIWVSSNISVSSNENKPYVVYGYQ